MRINQVVNKNYNTTTNLLLPVKEENTLSLPASVGKYKAKYMYIFIQNHILRPYAMIQKRSKYIFNVLQGVWMLDLTKISLFQLNLIKKMPQLYHPKSENWVQSSKVNKYSAEI